MRKKSCVYFACCLFLLVSGNLFSQSTTLQFRHPLDPLDTNEIKIVKQVLLKENKVRNDSSSLYSIINLQEPPKSEVLAYKPGDDFRREAFAYVYDYPANALGKAIIDLKQQKLLSFENIEGKQPVGAFKADSITSEIVKTNSEWIAALTKRGINPDSVKASGGNYAADLGLAPMGNREKIVSPVYKNKQFSRVPIGGIYAYVDVTDKKVLKVVDTGGGWSEPVKVNYFDGDSIKIDMTAPKQVLITQPEGVNYRIEGNQVISPHWKFRFSVHSREGLVIHDLHYFDHEQKKWRYIMYRGGLAEMIVNYGSPDLLNASNNYFDVGEFRLFQTKARPLAYGADAPENATYLPAVLHDDFGTGIHSDSAIAVFEEYGGVLWRHQNHARRATDLAIKYYITAGNYDYGFKWIFKEDGTVVIVTELNGIAHIRVVERVTDDPGSADESYQGNYFGTIVEPHVEANNHQHFFVFRLDLDIDGQMNSVGEMNTVAVPKGPENPYGNAIIGKMDMFKNELDAKRLANAATSRMWMVMNHHVKNKFNHMSSYMLMPSPGVVPLAEVGSSLYNRAAALYHHFWTTPYRADELYPAGDFPSSNQRNEGLPKWTEQNRNIENTDVVVWYVAGVNHIVRPEEWPIMNQHTVSITLMPFGFMSKNPVLGLPPVKLPISAN
jgi:primary-amine oxidase